MGNGWFWRATSYGLIAGVGLIAGTCIVEPQTVDVRDVNDDGFSDVEVRSIMHENVFYGDADGKYRSSLDRRFDAEKEARENIERVYFPK
jgi:hypothetical protein